MDSVTCEVVMVESGAESAGAQGMRIVQLNKDPMSALTHFVGFLVGLAGLVGLVVLSAGDVARMLSMGVYGTTLVMLFLASSTYHFFDLGEQGNQFLRRLDHAAIFLFIAGTYVPCLVHLLGGMWRVAMLSLVVGLAVLGALFKLVFYRERSGKAGVALYIILGWLVVIPAHKMFPQLPWSELGWLVGGGVVYSLGAVVYATKWPDPLPGRFGFHEVWHVFVLAAAALHFRFVYGLLGVTYPPFS